MPCHINPTIKQAIIADIRDNPNVTYDEIGQYYKLSCSSIAKLASRAGLRRYNVSMKRVQPDQKRVGKRKRINPTVSKIIKAIRASGHPGVTLEVIAGWTGVSTATVLKYTAEIPHPNRKSGQVLVSKRTGKALVATA